MTPTIREVKKYSIWSFFVPSKDRVETWHMQFCRAHQTLSTVVRTDLWISSCDGEQSGNSMRGILEIVSVVTVRP